MTLDRWRGQLGTIGWLVRKWDVWHIRRLARRMRRVDRRWSGTR